MWIAALQQKLPSISPKQTQPGSSPGSSQRGCDAGHSQGVTLLQRDGAKCVIAELLSGNNESNKERIMEAGVLPTLVSLL